ncbi:7-cyano-7-deazaguanine synthase QueC [Helicobacter cetorum]|uniref:7-cyano-7-deazaguanine synthase QueC n=1 Tax=Helicobacter cetorum TaxID=138563 RepID=UPI000CF162CE|nr:7-cyano-7-deazaguanine synthase QueC [Helicobacter cetorum]
MKQEICVISFSGGQDSTTLAVWATKHFKKVCLVGFDYAQKHSIELECATKIASFLQLPYEIIKLDFLESITNSALFKNSKDLVENSHTQHKNLPNSFVPNRNAIFITLLHSYAQKLGASNIALGVSQADFSGYPDCKEDFIKSIEHSLNLGSNTHITIHTPLMFLSKAQEFQMAKDLGILDLIIKETHTCYHGERKTLHAYGYGCNECPACKLRKKGYEEFMLEYN